MLILLYRFFTWAAERLLKKAIEREPYDDDEDEEEFEDDDEGYKLSG